MELLYYPDPFLFKIAEPVEKIDEEVREKVEEMFEVMYREGGVGLAAPQVGWGVRLFVMNVRRGEDDERDKSGQRVFINPVIKAWSPLTCPSEEGCLSIPGVTDVVPRRPLIQVTYNDLESGIIKPSENIEGMEALVFQHELDHLDGRLIIDLFDISVKSQHKDKLLKLESEYAALHGLADDTSTSNYSEPS